MDGKHPKNIWWGSSLSTSNHNYLARKRLVMKKIILLLTFFVLTLFVNGQDKVGHGNDPEGCDSAGVGTVTTWIKPEIQIDTTWRYTGIITVGYMEGTEYYGYDNLNFYFGSISPDLQNLKYFIYNSSQKLFCGLDSCLITSMYVDGNVFYPSWNATYGYWNDLSASNPFPAENETCIIKLRYKYLPSILDLSTVSLTNSEINITSEIINNESVDINNGTLYVTDTKYNELITKSVSAQNGVFSATINISSLYADSTYYIYYNGQISGDLYIYNTVDLVFIKP
jgi:hypothetical protein